MAWWDAATGQALTLMQTQRGHVEAVAWGPDSRLCAAGGQYGEVRGGQWVRAVGAGLVADSGGQVRYSSGYGVAARLCGEEEQGLAMQHVWYGRPGCALCQCGKVRHSEAVLHVRWHDCDAPGLLAF